MEVLFEAAVVGEVDDLVSRQHDLSSVALRQFENVLEQLALIVGELTVAPRRQQQPNLLLAVSRNAAFNGLDADQLEERAGGSVERPDRRIAHLVEQEERRRDPERGP